MSKWKELKKVKYEEDLDLGFADVLINTPGGEMLNHCIQCGTCSGMCPMSPYMDYSPRKIIAMIRAGFKQEVLSCFTTWLCASCYSCAVECPKSIKITDIMYALKQLAIEGGAYPKGFPIPVLAREFFDIVKTNGRNSEGPLILRLYAKTNPFKLLGMAGMGIKLMLTGRLSMKTDRIKNREQLAKLLEAVETAEAT